MCSPRRHKWYLFRSGLTEGQVSTIWTSTSGDGAKKQPTSEQMGGGGELISRSSVGLTQTGEAATDKRSTDLCPSKHSAEQRKDAL